MSWMDKILFCLIKASYLLVVVRLLQNVNIIPYNLNNNSEKIIVFLEMVT